MRLRQLLELLIEAGRTGAAILLDLRHAFIELMQCRAHGFHRLFNTFLSLAELLLSVRLLLIENCVRQFEEILRILGQGIGRKCFKAFAELRFCRLQ